MKKLILLAVLLVSVAYSQNVGIGTSAPLDKLHVAGNVRVNGLAGVGTRVVGSNANGTLVNIASGTNGQVLTQTAGGPVFQAIPAAAVASVSLAADYSVTAAAWTSVPGVTVTFTATKTSALVVFSASGFAFTGSMAFVQFRVRDSGAGTTIGGTNTHMQDYDDWTGTVTPWSCTFTKNVSGLTVGNSYTYFVQAQRGGILGTYTSVIQAATTPDSHHMTLSVIQ